MCDGSIMRWHASKNNSCEKIPLNTKNQYQTIDYSADGKRIAVAGLLPQIEVYDDETLQPMQIIGGGSKPHAHQNKIFSVKFNPIYPNQLYSGSWDQSVKFWDIRTGTATHTITGTQTCGDSIDMDQDLRTFVTGGGTGGEGIQIWDMRNLQEPVCKINWGQTASGDPINRTFNAVKFVPGMSMVIAGCTDDMPAKCFNFKTGGTVM